MGMIKVYGRLDCRDTQRVIASIFEHDLQFDFIPIDLNAQENQTQAFLSLSPFGETPVFQDADLIVFESRAAMRYIAHHYIKPGKEPMVYKEPKLQGIAATWIDVEDHQFNAPSSKLITEFIDKPRSGLAADRAVVEEEEAKLGKVLDVYEERLKESKYLGGDKFTSADLTHLPNLQCLLGTPVRKLFEERPLVGAWCRDVMSRPAWAKVVGMVEKKLR